MASTEERLGLLEDENSILQTLYAYGHALDYGLEADFMNCWTQDAVLHWPDRAPIRGHAAIRAAFHGHTHAPMAWHKHMLFEPRIRMEAGRATVHSMFARLDRYPAGPAVRSFGCYRDTLVRCEDGCWRFVERRSEREATRCADPIGLA